jgi:hypothetical protein
MIMKLSRQYVAVLALMLTGWFLSSCSKPGGIVGPNPSGDTTRITFMGSVYFLYNSDGKLKAFHKRDLPYLKDSCYVFYDNNSRLSKVVRVKRSTGNPIYYSVAYFHYSGTKVNLVTVAGVSTYLTPEVSTIGHGVIGIDTVTCARRTYLEYDAFNRLSKVYAIGVVPCFPGGDVNYVDLIHYPDNVTKNISMVTSDKGAFGRDTLYFPKYDTNANPIYKYNPDYFYASMIHDWEYKDVMQKIVFGANELYRYTALCPNYFREMRFWYAFVYTMGYDTYTLNNIYDSRGNLKSSGLWLDLIAQGTAVLYNYD